jgi:hypothetical protein
MSTRAALLPHLHSQASKGQIQPGQQWVKLSRQYKSWTKLTTNCTATTHKNGAIVAGTAQAGKMYASG